MIVAPITDVVVVVVVVLPPGRAIHVTQLAIGPLLKFVADDR